MQKKYLALTLSAILATTLTGCGSDNDSNYTPPPATKPDTGTTTPGTGTTTPETGTTTPGTEKPEPKPETPKPKPETPKPEAPTVTDPTGTGASVQGKIDKQNTWVGQNYIRNTEAKFDYDNNRDPANDGTPSPLGYLNLNSQNPELTNIVIGQETVTKNNKTGTFIRYAGNLSNKHNDQDASNTTTNASGNTAYAGQSQPNPYTLQTENEVNVWVPNGATNSTLYYALDNLGKRQNPARNVDLFSNILTDAQNTNTTPSGFTGPRTAAAWLGLVAVDSRGVAGEEATLGARQHPNAPNTNYKVYPGQDTNTTTRIFGKNYDGVYADNVLTRESSHTNGLGQPNNSYQLVSNEAKKGLGAAPADPYRIETVIKPIKLNEVQYGRVSNNIDVLTETQISGADVNPNPNKASFYGAVYKPRDAKDAVSNYFYRGTNATTPEQMGQLKEGVYQYSGHALMYGLDNSYHGKTVSGTPNAFGPGGATTAIGNFVDAEFDVASKKVAGYVYNAWLNNTAAKTITKDKLVTFKGDVRGNSIVGDAERTYAAGAGDFKGSFYGKDASEMGGNINSITGDDYGKANWGGVFGVKKIGESGNKFIIEDNK